MPNSNMVLGTCHLSSIADKMAYPLIAHILALLIAQLVVCKPSTRIDYKLLCLMATVAQVLITGWDLRCLVKPPSSASNIPMCAKATTETSNMQGYYDRLQAVHYILLPNKFKYY
jgi:hypothetical protein